MSLEPEYTMVTLEASTYRDINLDSPLPVITESSVATYLHVLDAKVTKIAKDQYNERYLSYCRYAPGHVRACVCLPQIKLIFICIYFF